LGSLASSFYVVHATSAMQLPPAAIGLFAGAFTIGTTLAGLGLGPVADRHGSHRVVQVATWSQVFVPVLALLLHFGVFGESKQLTYLVLYVLLGLFDGSLVMGFLNYVLEIAPAGQRPNYMGLTNTLSGLLILMPLLGGWILEVGSYPLLFGLAAAGTLLSALMALRLSAPPRAAHTPAAPLDGGHHVLPIS
jgi:MFS family permease